MRSFACVSKSYFSLLQHFSDGAGGNELGYLLLLRLLRSLLLMGEEENIFLAACSLISLFFLSST